MKILYRLGYYLGGFSVGLIFLAFILNGKKTSCNYTPNARVIDNLLQKNIKEQTVEEKIQQLVTKIGEKISIRRFEKIKIDKQVGIYLHGKRIGVIVEMDGGDDSMFTIKSYKGDFLHRQGGDINNGKAVMWSNGVAGGSLWTIVLS